MKALVLASGGVDSTTCLGLAVNKYGKENVIALTEAHKRNRGCQKNSRILRSGASLSGSGADLPVQ